MVGSLIDDSLQDGGQGLQKSPYKEGGAEKNEAENHHSGIFSFHLPFTVFSFFYFFQLPGQM